jgi:hypothetical protein
MLRHNADARRGPTPPETENRNKVVSDRDELARKMTPRQIAKA